MSESKTPEITAGVNPLLIALVAFLAGVALMYGVGMYITSRGSENAGNHDAS